MESPESKTNSLSSGFIEKAREYTTLRLFYSHVLPISQASLRPLALLPRYLHGCNPQILERRKCALEDERVEPLQVMVFFPVFFADRKASGAHSTHLFGLNEVVPFRRIDLTACGSASTHPDCFAIRTRATDPVPPPFLSCFGCLSVSLFRN